MRPIRRSTSLRPEGSPSPILVQGDGQLAPAYLQGLRQEVALDVRQLEFFVAVAEERNFTRAAARSYVSQPGLSSSIRALERELKARLFDRGSAGASLTEAGTRFLPRARRIIGDARAAQSELLEAPGAKPLLVRIGAEQCLGDLVDLVDLVATFAQRVPSVELSLMQSSTAELVENIGVGALDVALIARGAMNSPREGALLNAVSSTLLRREPFCVVTSSSHRLAGRTAVGWAELRDEPFVDLSLGWAARRVLDESCASAGIARRSPVSVSDVHMMLAMVGRGFGVAVVPHSIASKPEGAELATVPFATESGEPVIEWEVSLATASGASSAAMAFAAMMIPHPQITASQTHLES